MSVYFLMKMKSQSDATPSIQIRNEWFELLGICQEGNWESIQQLTKSQLSASEMKQRIAPIPYHQLTRTEL